MSKVIYFHRRIRTTVVICSMDFENFIVDEFALIRLDIVLVSA